MRAFFVLALCSLATAASAQTVRYGLTDRPRARWSVESRPIVEIGGASGTGPSEFTKIVGATRLSDGSIVIADGGSSELRHFAANGRFLSRIARKGRGPGELREIEGLTSIGDTLIAFEGREAVQLFTAKGWLRSTRRPSLAGHIVQIPQAALRPDVTVWWVRTGNEQSIRAIGDSVFVGRVQADSALRLIASLPLAPTYALPGRPSIYPLGFAPSAHVVAHGDRICLGFASAYTIRCVDERGRTLLSVERQVRTFSVTAADKAAFRRAKSGLRADGTSRYEGSLRVHREAVAAAAQFASRYPAYSQLLFSRTGELWVRDFAPADGLTADPWRSNPTPSRWSVYSSTGEWLAELQLPARFAPAEIGADYVLGVMSDEDDVERVVLWSLRR